MEPVQIVLLVVIVALTILLAFLGIQVFLILREIRKTVEKTNKVLDDAGIITESIATPVSALSSLAMSVRTGISFASWLKKIYVLFSQHAPFKETKETSEGISDEVTTPDDKAKEYPSPDLNLGFGGHANADAEHNSAFQQEDKKPSIRRFFRGISRKRII